MRKRCARTLSLLMFSLGCHLRWQQKFQSCVANCTRCRARRNQPIILTQQRDRLRRAELRQETSARAAADVMGPACCLRTVGQPALLQ